MRSPSLLERLEQGPVICAEGYLFECERRGYLQAGAFVSDVVEAFTYYAHREKLRVIGREGQLEELNRRALELAREVADETGTLLAGNISNTNVFVGVDYLIGETFSFGEEALIALGVIAETGLPSVITLAIHRDPVTYEGWTPEDACARLADAGADVVGLNCIRGPRTMLPLLRRIREAVDGHVAALPVPYRTDAEHPTFQ